MATPFGIERFRNVRSAAFLTGVAQLRQVPGAGGWHGVVLTGPNHAGRSS